MGGVNNVTAVVLHADKFHFPQSHHCVESQTLDKKKKKTVAVTNVGLQSQVVLGCRAIAGCRSRPDLDEHMHAQT